MTVCRRTAERQRRDSTTKWRYSDHFMLGDGGRQTIQAIASEKSDWLFTYFSIKSICCKASACPFSLSATPLLRSAPSAC